MYKLNETVLPLELDTIRSSEFKICWLYILVSKCAIVIVVSDLASFVMTMRVKQNRNSTAKVHL